MPNPDRLSGLDASFLSLERAGAHMHVGSVLVFEGAAPAPDELTAQLERRLHLVPRYRQKLAFPPLAPARPVWVDDPHFKAGYHVRHTALPAPAGEDELRRLAGRSSPKGSTAPSRCGRSGSSTGSATTASRSCARRTTHSWTGCRA